MMDRLPASCEGAGFIAAVYTASSLSTATTKRAAQSSVSVVTGPILLRIRDAPTRARRDRAPRAPARRAPVPRRTHDRRRFSALPAEDPRRSWKSRPGAAPNWGTGGVVEVEEDVPREQVALGHVRVAGQDEGIHAQRLVRAQLRQTWSGSPTMAAPAPDRARPIPVHS